MTISLTHSLFLLLVALGTAAATWSIALYGHRWVSLLIATPAIQSLGSFPAARILACLALGGCLGLLMGSALWALSAALILALLSRAHTRWQTRQRARQIERQIPDFCDALTGALRAGATLRAAVSQSRDQLTLPIRAEIDRLLNLFRLGLSQEDALARWAESSGLIAVRDLAFCAGVSSRSGGSLAPLVESIGQNLSAELALQAKADALTSQGRLQAIVMIGIPPALLLMTGVMDPAVWGFFFQTSLGSLLLWIVVVLELIGLVWIRKITQVRRAN